MRTAALFLLATCGLSALSSAAAKPCAAGDLPCACAAARGKWRELKAPLQPTCTVTFQHQGEQFSTHALTNDGGDPGRNARHRARWRGLR